MLTRRPPPPPAWQNAPGAGNDDSPETAREMILRLHEKLGATSSYLATCVRDAVTPAPSTIVRE